MVSLERSRTRLENELARVQTRIQDLRLEPEPEELASGGDNTPLSEEVDAAAIAEERELREKLLGSFVERAEALEEALRRVADGTYGFCEACHAKIPESRLDALPEVSLCAACQAKRERDASRRRPDNRPTI